MKNRSFLFFLVVISLYWVLYVQIYNLIPLYLRFISPSAPVELYTMTNPLIIVCLQMLITRFVSRLSAVRSIMLGVALSSIGILLNLLPVIFKQDLFARVEIAGVFIPLGGIYIILSIGGIALGEMMASPRIYECIGSIAPKGQEGLYLGYVNLPLAFGTIVGAPLGGMLFQKFIRKPFEQGAQSEFALLWIVVAGIGVISLCGVFLYDLFLKKISARKADQTV